MLNSEADGKMTGRLQMGNVGEKLRLRLRLRLSLRLRSRFRFWQGHNKSAPLIRGARCCDVSTVSPGYGPGQAETQSDTSLRPALITSVEPLKNTGKITGRNTNHCVFDRDNDVCVILPKGNGYLSF
jgi:hypothetical protein